MSWLPACLDSGVAVSADASLDRHTYDVRNVENPLVLVTSPYPLDIPGVPRDRNLNGVGFDVANASAFVAQALDRSRGSEIETVFARLREDICAPRA